MLGFVRTKWLTHPGIAFTEISKFEPFCLTEFRQVTHFSCALFFTKNEKVFGQNTECRKCQIILDVFIFSVVQH